jgi:hypothetical protein
MRHGLFARVRSGRRLIELWRSIEDGEPSDETAFEACLANSAGIVQTC